MRVFFSAIMVSAALAFSGPLSAQTDTDGGSAAGANSAGTNPVVVELYTSQGCSSCPPADAILHDLAAQPGIIALALHVDYWDYIGWKDSFASPAFTARQQDYARAAGSRMVYTPQMIIGGSDQVVGSKTVEVMAQIANHADQITGVSVTLRRDGDVLRISAEVDPDREGGMEMRPMVIQLVRYTPSEHVDIAHGENAGRSVTYTNIVTTWDVLGDWSGETPYRQEAPAGGDSPAVVIVQQQGHGPILAAAALP